MYMRVPFVLVVALALSMSMNTKFVQASTVTPNCNAGQYSKQVSGGFVCTACPNGYFSPGGAALSCTAYRRCVPGEKVVSAGTASADRQCEACGAGTFSTRSNAADCTVHRACSAGRYVVRQPSATNDRLCRHYTAVTTVAAIESQFARLNAAWATLNADTVTALFSKNPLLLATVSSQYRDSTALVREYFVTFLQKQPFGTITASTTRVDGVTATRAGLWTVRLTDPVSNVVTNVQARFTFIYRYEEDDWKIDHLHSSVLPPGLF